MAPAVRLLFADPRTEILEAADGIWVVSGVDPGRLASFLTEAPTVESARDSLPDVAEDAVVAHVAFGTDGPVSVDAYRSVVSNRNLYYHRSADGTLVLADQYRNAVSQIPAADRTAAETAVTDHLLFRAPVPPTTYLREVRAVEHGSWVHWDLAGGERTETRVGTLSGDARPGHDRPTALGETISTVLDRGTGGDADVANLLSGGVDSTLLQTYLEGVPALLLEPDSPELAFEVDYAEDAVELLDAPHRRVPLRESAYLDQLAASMERLGFPSHYSLTAPMDAVFAADDTERYVCGEGADALFGLTGVTGNRAAARFDPVVRSPVGRLAGSLPDPMGTYARTIRTYAERAHRSPAHPESYAQQFAFFTDPALAAEFVGDEAVDRRSQRQFEYVTARIAQRAHRRYDEQLELGHLMSFYGHTTVAQWRQLAYAHGKSFFAPFKTRSVAALSQSIPVPRRYADDDPLPHRTRTKHVPKRLLDRRLPAYETDKPKGGGVYPRQRFFESGCLADVFERYEPPSFVPAAMYADHVDSWGPLTWNLITWAMWRDRVLENDDLDLLPGTTEIRCEGDRVVEGGGTETTDDAVTELEAE